MARTTTFDLAQTVLKSDLRQFIASRREQGKTWGQINKQLYVATKGAVDVTDKTIQNWMRSYRNGDEAA